MAFWMFCTCRYIYTANCSEWEMDLLHNWDIVTQQADLTPEEQVLTQMKRVHINSGNY